MAFGPIGNSAGLSGSQNDAASQLRKTKADHKAQRAEGLGATEGDTETSDRDADGRRLWERAQEQAEDGSVPEDPAHDESTKTNPVRQSKDATGDTGGLLDLTG